MTVRPFFSFYGGKWRDAIKHYPPPAYRHIVEPFAGSAGYALRWPALHVSLFDIDPVIVGVWDYLIHVTPSELLALPDVAEHIDELRVCQEARWLIGFWLNRGAAAPRKRPSSWMRSGTRPGSFWGPRVRERIASQLGAIAHWRITQGSYPEAECADPATTYFVDPPYQGAGVHYTHGSNGIDYAALGSWCKGLVEQVIVCENSGADWLPFSPLRDVKTTRRDMRSKEAVWLSV